jgi:hypothetical protein
MGREGAAKRRMLSLAESPSVEVEACWGVVPLTGAADGIVTVAGSQLTMSSFLYATGVSE